MEISTTPRIIFKPAFHLDASTSTRSKQKVYKGRQGSVQISMTCAYALRPMKTKLKYLLQKACSTYSTQLL